MDKKNKIIEKHDVVIKFAGDSGDGMQMTGTQFSEDSAFIGVDLATFPDFPSEIRAPQGTVAGVSGFQVHIGKSDIQTPGDKADVLIAMNPAALKKNLKWVKPGATIIIDIDNFDNKYYKKAGYIEDPLHDKTLSDYNLVKAPITSLTKATVHEFGMDSKTVSKIKNQFVSGLLYWLFNREVKLGEDFLKLKFKGNKKLIDANTAALHAGYDYAETVEALAATFMINPRKNKNGKFRNIKGNVATAWGLIAAAEKAGKELFLGSYPITPATDILQELSKRMSLGVKTFQAEDEIAAVCSAIGAAFAGKLAATSTSGPGLALKSEGIGLAIMTELPLVVINVQRGGPSTGLPTKPEQGDLLQALYGRNGESPCVVIAASTPANCFHYTYMAAKIAMEHMIPVILLTDGYLANGSELWQIPNVNHLPKIEVPHAKENDFDYQPYKRDPDKLNRFWAYAGQAGLRHRLGGLEKEDVTGELSHNPINHQIMVTLREMKTKRVRKYLPKSEIDLLVEGEKKGDLLIVGWGGTYGALHAAVKGLRNEGMKVSLAQFHYIKPMPQNTREIFMGFKKILVCELNLGQFVKYLRSKYPELSFEQYNKVQGLPFMIAELKNIIRKKIGEIEK